jgi:hypothetical protein
MPIATDESFRIEYSQTRGMEIEFYRSNKVVLRQYNDATNADLDKYNVEAR